MSTQCVFCRIVRGELPSVRLYEDDAVLAFMDIGPIVKGHALVIPKRHYDPITETPDDVLGRLVAVVRRIASAQMSGLGADGVNVHQTNGAVAGQVVPHVHFHVIPRFRGDGHSWNWRAKRYDDPSEMEALAGRIRGGLATPSPT
jgi:histidine triad (HIT) family protein